MRLVGIGYAVRRAGEAPAYPRAGLTDVYTVARCRPGGRMLLESFDAVNGLGLCDTVAGALEAARSNGGSVDAAQRVFGYEMLPVIHTEDADKTVAIEGGSEVEPMPASFERIGFDAVEFQQHDGGGSFGCSPLSCNGMVMTLLEARPQ